VALFAVPGRKQKFLMIAKAIVKPGQVYLNMIQILISYKELAKRLF